MKTLITLIVLAFIASPTAKAKDLFKINFDLHSCMIETQETNDISDADALEFCQDIETNDKIRTFNPQTGKPYLPEYKPKEVK